MKVHAGLVWVALPPGLADELEADPRTAPLLALRLDPRTIAVRESDLRSLREALARRGQPVEEVGEWTER